MAAETVHLRRHPDLFTGLEACAYLHLPEDDGGLRTLETYRAKGWLLGHQHGRELIYWREDLDACVLRIVGRAGQPVPARSRRRQVGPQVRVGFR